MPDRTQGASKGAGTAARPVATADDGRARRARRTRLAIVDALRSLHADGVLAPTAADVAARAGISRRTVWQHFEDREQLMLEAGRRDFEIATSMAQPIDVDQSREARVALFTASRARLYEAMTPSWRAGRLVTPTSEELRRNARALIAIGTAEVAKLFGAELRPLPAKARREVQAALVAASSWSTWEAYRVELDLDVEPARSAVARTLLALLAAADAEARPRR